MLGKALEPGHGALVTVPLPHVGLELAFGTDYTVRCSVMATYGVILLEEPASGTGRAVVVCHLVFIVARRAQGTAALSIYTLVLAASAVRAFV